MRKVEAVIYDISEALPPVNKEVICFMNGKPVIGKIIKHSYDGDNTHSGEELKNKPIWKIGNDQTKTPEGWMVIHKIDLIN